METAAKLERAERNAGSGRRAGGAVTRIESFKASSAKLVAVPFKIRPAGPAQARFISGAVCHHSDGDMHDCAYVETRNRLINQATQVARGRILGAGEDVNGAKFSRAFMDAMTELWLQHKGS